jgi:hypothetical protein
MRNAKGLLSKEKRIREEKRSEAPERRMVILLCERYFKPGTSILAEIKRCPPKPLDLVLQVIADTMRSLTLSA